MAKDNHKYICFKLLSTDEAKNLMYFAVTVATCILTIPFTIILWRIVKS